MTMKMMRTMMMRKWGWWWWKRRWWRCRFTFNLSVPQLLSPDFSQLWVSVFWPDATHSPTHRRRYRAAVFKSALSMAEHILSLKTQKALRPGFDWATAETRHVVSALRPLMGSLGEIRHSPLLLRIMIPRTQSHRNTRPPPTPPLSSSSPSFMALWQFLDLLQKKISHLCYILC